MEFTSAMYVIQLSYLNKFSEQEGIPTHYLGVALEECVYGESLYGYDLREKNTPNKQIPTLQSFLNDYWTRFPVEPVDKIFVTFGRTSDFPISRTVAHLQTEQDLHMSPARYIIVQDNLWVR